MAFQVGDKVIHLSHGLGDIVKIEDKTIHNSNVRCYEVRTSNLTVWVPVDAGTRHSLRDPTPRKEFTKLFAVLQEPAEALPEDRYERQKKLLAMLNDGQLISVCRVVRDLSNYASNKKLGADDKSILERARNSLLTEWVFSLSVPLSKADRALRELLDS